MVTDTPSYDVEPARYVSLSPFFTDQKTYRNPSVAGAEPRKQRKPSLSNERQIGGEYANPPAASSLERHSERCVEIPQIRAFSHPDPVRRIGENPANPALDSLQ